MVLPEYFCLMGNADTDKVAGLLYECRKKMALTILPPDVNASALPRSSRRMEMLLAGRSGAARPESGSSVSFVGQAIRLR